MNFFGFSITRQKALPQTLSSVDSRGGWWPLIREVFSGSWQRNIEVSHDEVTAFSTVYACVSLISSDIAKMPMRLVRRDANGIWDETENPAYSPVLRRPNHYQNRIEFFEHWILCKLLRGNAYALKERDERGVVSALYLLDPSRVTVLVAPNGDVYYRLNNDALSRLEDQVVVPASEIIHDKMPTLHHTLVGVSPIYACGLAAMQGLHIQQHSAKWFANGAQPSGILTSPGAIDAETAVRLQEQWTQQFAGNNLGKIAVAGNGLTYEQLTMSAVDSQLIEQLNMSGLQVCSAFKVFPYLVGIGPMPTNNNVEALAIQHHSHCLQKHIESLQLCLDEGLEIKKPYGTEFDIDALLWMDSSARMMAAEKAVRSGMAVNEVRLRYHDLGPVKGGDVPFLQQQDWPIDILAQRDLADLSGAGDPAPSRSEVASRESDEDDEPEAEMAAGFGVQLRKELELSMAQ